MWLIIVTEKETGENIGLFHGFADEDSAISWARMFVDQHNGKEALVTESIHFSACQPVKRMFANYLDYSYAGGHKTICSGCLHRATSLVKPLQIVEGFPCVECELCNAHVDDDPVKSL